MPIRHRIRLEDLPAPVRAALRRFLGHLEARTGTGWKTVWLTKPSRYYRCMIEARGIKAHIRYRSERGQWAWAAMSLPPGVRRLIKLHTGIDPTAKAREARRVAYERKRQQAKTSVELRSQNRQDDLDPPVQDERVNPPIRAHNGSPSPAPPDGAARG